MSVPKTGPLTSEDLQALWRSSLDPSYTEPLERAGDGEGLEVHGQMLEIFKRVSFAIDRTTQRMFIAPWSGQTNPSASGEVYATVTLTFERTKQVHRALVLVAGTFVAEVALDHSLNGPIEVLTGRRYRLTEDLVFNPGEMGPFDVVATAEFPGEGYNNPIPGSLRRIVQPGASSTNEHATVKAPWGSVVAATLVTQSQLRVSTPNVPDTFIPEHVGQYVYFYEGPNTGFAARMKRFEGPDFSVNPPVGSRALFAWEFAFEGTVSGDFEIGETIVNAGIFYATVLGFRSSGPSTVRMTVELLARTSYVPNVGDVITGVKSGATITVDFVSQNYNFVDDAPVANVGGTSWRVYDWALSFGLEVTNALSPEGGAIGWLDEIGAERDIRRAPNESDENYIKRIRAFADVVTPNAIKRSIQRVLGSIPWCFREAGTEGLPGFFYDGNNLPPSTSPHSPENDAYDVDVLVLQGFPGVGTFQFQEPVEFEDADTGDNFATGYFGRIDGGATLTLIRRQGRYPLNPPANMRVRGIRTGATWIVVADTPVITNTRPRRFRTWLDHADMRGYFIVTLPPLAMGEFGLSYDEAQANAYDLTGDEHVFFDGFPWANQFLLRRLYQAVDSVHAGGVGFDLRFDNGPCP